jgi:hypothetical protein
MDFSLVRTLVVALSAVALAASLAEARARAPAHPIDETEVFTGGEEVEPGQAPRRPAVTYWKLTATLRVGASTQPVHIGLLVPLSDGRQDVLARRAAATGFRFREDAVAQNLRAEWAADASAGGTLTYDVAARV